MLTVEGTMVPVMGTPREPAAKTLVGSNLRALRHALGETQKAIGERSGLTRETISDIERGDSANPDHATVAGLARALGVGVLRLYVPTGDLMRWHPLVEAARDLHLLDAHGPTSTDWAVLNALAEVAIPVNQTGGDCIVELFLWLKRCRSSNPTTSPDRQKEPDRPPSDASRAGAAHGGR